jgi:Effector Associated Constant Component 1
MLAENMSSSLGDYELYLEVGEGADDDELDQYRRSLQGELNELDGINYVRQISAGEAPEGSRAIDMVVIGALAVALKQSGVFDAVVQVLKTWIENGARRKEKRKVVIKRPDGTMLQFDGYNLKEIRSSGDLPETSGKA